MLYTMISSCWMVVAVTKTVVKVLLGNDELQLEEHGCLS